MVWFFFLSITYYIHVDILCPLELRSEKFSDFFAQISHNFSKSGYSLCIQAREFWFLKKWFWQIFLPEAVALETACFQSADASVFARGFAVTRCEARREIARNAPPSVVFYETALIFLGEIPCRYRNPGCTGWCVLPHCWKKTAAPIPESL